MKRLVPFSILSSLTLAATFASAQTPPSTAGKTGDAAAAQALFYEGRTLAQRGHFQEACPKFEESLRLDYGIGTLFNLADCNEKTGKLATAWSGFLEVAADAKAQNQQQREKLARDRAKAIEPRLPKLVIEVAVPTTGLEVKRDGVVVGTPQWGTPVPVDPGTHTVVATAPGREKWETTVVTTEGKQAKVVVKDLAHGGVAAKPAVLVPPPSNAAVRPEPATQTYFPEPVVENRGSAQRTVGWIVTGLGAASVGVGAGFGIYSLSKRNDANSECVGDFCNAEGVALRDDAMKAGDIATITSIAGGAAILGGILLVATAPSSKERAPQTSKRTVTPSFNIANGGGGIGLSGSFQ